MKAFLYFLFALPAVVSLSASAAEDAAVIVETVTAVRSDSVSTAWELTGTVVSKRHAKLSSRAEGLVEKVLVDAGSKVEKGDVLLTLDTRLAEIELELIHAEIETAQVQLEDAEREREEVRRLTSSGAFAKSEAASREANARIRAAEMKALEVRGEQQKERIERHQLVAPFSGSIAKKTTEEGEWVETGTTVFELVETDSLWFDLQVAQEFLAAVESVESAVVRLDAYPDRELTAEIDVVVPVKDPISRTFLTRLTFDDPEGQASPGMSGTAHLQVRSSNSGNISVPRDAVTRYPDGSAKVWVVRGEDGGQVARSVTVITAGGLGETVEIEKGLQGGERVVVRGNEGLSEGQKVEARERKTNSSPSGL
ncbi:MAG: efflux RND transporter periplasmic adaptor subunit [Verrucomicrobiales bacterium]|nr:efflux RND transporter periplasmic adaptor subunit [Verrucomicrobiales bacterium]